ncbi:hypothetical protein [Chitinophaga niabensis]|uniref:Uncharacterized protein n=1 Tax=Chitinophaga niabensis TaxID=536979 RepID=A0A1N6E3N4_9BACT|nr:hypothetical protein [Chitinophaga niabensis]SIN77685.1 hypothetical protein SAMN04488055_1282 [Chitinophaga niabensis]
MDKIKNKYEIILGFAAVFISLSAFKDELKNILVDLGWLQFTLADYFLVVVLSFSCSLYLYVIEHMASDTKFGSKKLFVFLPYAAYFIFIITLCTPVAIVLNWVIYKLFNSESEKAASSKDVVAPAIGIIMSMVAIVISYYVTKWNAHFQRLKIAYAIELQKIRHLESASRLFQDGYFSHSILEALKVLEGHLYKKLFEKKIHVSRNRFNDLIRHALQQNIITELDIPAINQIKEMRNSAAHSDVAHNKEQAQFALDFVRELISR